MKFLVFFSTIFFLGPLSLSSQTPASSGMTAKFKVYGNCGMCEKRIEKAAKIDGVLQADWDADSQMLRVTFDETKVKPGKIHQAVAAIGHDTEKARADDKVYAQLHGCCQYERPAKP